ncbi:MAG: NRDE family protein, partial [Aquincola sp.]|nr:NRDE family protein [Aquincola sp.]
LTNVRDPKRHRPDAPSRGALVAEWLASAGDAQALLPGWVRRGCNPFNLIGGDLATGQWWWGDDRSAAPQPLSDGVHALSNASLDVPWPKVLRVRDALAAALGISADAKALAASLLDALSDRSVPPDGDLPDTGIGLARERALAPVFIHAAASRYGTRSSTVLVGERTLANRWLLTVVERRYDASGRPLEERMVQLAGWPGAARAPVQVRPAY